MVREGLRLETITGADVGLVPSADFNDEDLLASLQGRLSVVDYCVFALLLRVSGAIRLWFGFKKKQKTTTDFLMGGRRMGTFPMAMSLIARYLDFTRGLLCEYLYSLLRSYLVHLFSILIHPFAVKTDSTLLFNPPALIIILFSVSFLAFNPNSIY